MQYDSECLDIILTIQFDLKLNKVQHFKLVPITEMPSQKN